MDAKEKVATAAMGTGAVVFVTIWLTCILASLALPILLVIYLIRHL